jgi:predicted component of type VI protein secretion system
MEPTIAGHEAVTRKDGQVHAWRVSQLTRLGIPGLLAEIYADHLDWHQIARLVQRGCSPLLALRIVC